MTVHPTQVVLPHRFSAKDGTQLLTVELPSLESLKDVDLDIGSKEVRLLVPGNVEHSCIPLPFQLLDASALPTAKFSRKRGELTIAWDSPVLAKPAIVVPAVTASTNAKPAAAVPEVTASTNTKPAAVVAELPASTYIASAVPARSGPVESSRSVVGGEKSSLNVGAPKAEEKDEACDDCFEFLEEEIQHVLRQMSVSKLKCIAAIGGANVLLSDFVIEGDASIQKRRCNFKANVAFKWDIMDPFGGFLGSSGTGEILDFTQNGSSPKVAMRVAPGGSMKAKAAGEWMKKQGACLISESLNGKDISETVFTDWDEAEAEVEAPKVVDQKTLTQWATTWLEERLAALDVKLFGGSASATFASPQVSGEVSMSVQDGKPIASFQLRVECAWTITTSVPPGKSEGTLVVSEFTSKQGSDTTEVVVEASPGGKKVSGQLLTGLRQSGVSAIRGILARFMNELQLQIKG